MNILPRSLRGLTVVFLGWFLVVTILAGLGTFFGTLSRINALVDQRIETESRTLAPDGAAIRRDELVRRMDEVSDQRDTADMGLLLTDANGKWLAGNVRLGRHLPLGFSSLGRSDSIAGLSFGRAYVRDIGSGLRLAVFAETEPIDHYFAVRQRLYLVGFGSIVLVVLSGLLLFRRLIGQRIGDMRRTVDSIIGGDLRQRVPVVGDGDDFDQQAMAFNRMLDRISELMAEVRNVSNNISHELRTPLARLRNDLALLEQRPEAASVRAELEQATQQADDLLMMFSGLLRIAEIDSGDRGKALASLDVGELAAEVVDLLQPVAEELGQLLTTGQCEESIMRGDRLLLSQMLINLIENSLRHCPPGTVVTVGAGAAPDGVQIVVEDNGPGIPVDQRHLVLRRFHRLDRDRTNSGHGLGLPLVAAIARFHRGSLNLEDAGPGLRAVVHFP